jgi:hypothetical protein
VEQNPYAPPRSSVDDGAGLAARATEDAVALWNPNAAASWSLLLSPIFGGILVSRNWVALGRPDKAKITIAWVVVSGLVHFVQLFVDAKWNKFLALPLLLGWYFSDAKPQVRYVAERFGDGYPRRKWARPLLIALLALIVYGGLRMALLRSSAA